MPRHRRKYRFTGSLAESYCCPTSANRPPRWVATKGYCVGPVLSVPDSSAPSPPGPSGSGLFAEGVNPDTGPTKVGPFSFAGRFARGRIQRATARLPKPASVSEEFEIRVSAVRSWPRRASRPACRGCRPEHRRPRHRRRRGKYFPAEWSSFPHRRSSRRPSRDCAPHCSR